MYPFILFSYTEVITQKLGVILNPNFLTFLNNLESSGLLKQTLGVSVPFQGTRRLSTPKEKTIVLFMGLFNLTDADRVLLKVFQKEI